MRIGVVAPSTPIERGGRRAGDGAGGRAHPRRRARLPSAMLPHHNHFAGSDAARADAFVEIANDPGLSTPSGSRAAATARAGSPRTRWRGSAPAARDKAYLGYSDAGFLLAGLYAPAFRSSPTGRCRRTSSATAATRRSGARSAGWSDGHPKSLEPGARRAGSATPPSTSPCSASCSARRSSPTSPAMC